MIKADSIVIATRLFALNANSGGLEEAISFLVVIIFLIFIFGILFVIDTLYCMQRK